MIASIGSKPIRDYNLYRYCHNDPINKSDPTGLETLTRPEMDGEIGDRVVQASQFIGHQVAVGQEGVSRE